MKYLLSLLLVLASGCTPLVVKEPIGSDFSIKELKSFEGAWKLETEGDEPLILQLKKMDDEGRFQTAFLEWDRKGGAFQMNEMEIILKKGTKYGILHLVGGGVLEDLPEGLYAITLFRVGLKGKAEYWMTEADEAEEFLESGVLKTEKIEGGTVIADQPEKIIKALEASFEEIFDTESPTRATKLF